jgi:hypothetical protein
MRDLHFGCKRDGKTECEGAMAAVYPCVVWRQGFLRGPQKGTKSTKYFLRFLCLFVANAFSTAITNDYRTNKNI